MTTMSSSDELAANKKHRDALYVKLAPLLAFNEKIVGFCTLASSVVTLTVAPADEAKLYRKQYNLPTAVIPLVSKTVNDWFAAGKISYAPANTRFNNPLLGVPKKDDTGRMTEVRVCIDPRPLNTFLVEEEKFQIPHIPDVLNAFAGNMLFGEYDLSSAYFQFTLHPDSRKYTAFTWDRKQYVFVGVPFGIKHIPSRFQRVMSEIFRDMPFVVPYIDNLGFASMSWHEHFYMPVAFCSD